MNESEHLKALRAYLYDMLALTERCDDVDATMSVSSNGTIVITIKFINKV
jgi:hypothetical protein